MIRRLLFLCMVLLTINLNLFLDYYMAIAGLLCYDLNVISETAFLWFQRRKNKLSTQERYSHDE
ncbi:MAG: hypothetical protein K2O64_07185, partial [Lactobacillus sp.]|nr:hypothetical protein [Lactobacillus sp.]